MEMPPFEVASLLYRGISDTIDRLKKEELEGSWDDYDTREYLSLEVAIKWYEDNCTLSSSYLKTNYDELSKAIKGKYFLYNHFKNHRFTLKYQLAGEQKIDYNCLIDAKHLRVEDIVVGKIIKANGMYAKITESFQRIDNKFGMFIAEALSIEELLQMKEGEN